MSLQTKLGEKVSIVVDRLYELWEGKKEKGGKSPNIKVSQPISQNKALNANHVNNQQNQSAQKRVSFSDGTSINDLPTTNVGKQQLPDYDNMYRNDNNPLVNAATPGMETNNIVAANDVLGGSFSSFGSW